VEPRRVSISRLQVVSLALLAIACTRDPDQSVLADLAPPCCFEIRYEYPTAIREEFLFPGDPFGWAMPGPFVRLMFDSTAAHPGLTSVELVDPTGERIGAFDSGWEVMSGDSIKLWWRQAMVTTWYRLRVTGRDLVGRAWYGSDVNGRVRFDIPGRSVRFLRRRCEELTGPAAAAEARLIHFGPPPDEAPFWPYDSADYSGGWLDSPTSARVELLNPREVHAAVDRELGPHWDSSMAPMDFDVTVLVDRTGRTVETRLWGPIGLDPSLANPWEEAVLRVVKVARFRHTTEGVRILPTWEGLTIRYPNDRDSR